METKQQQTNYIEIVALLIVVLVSLAANLPQQLIGHAVDREVLLAVLATLALIALFRHIRFLLFITIAALTLGANLPGDFAAVLGVNPVALIAALAVLVAVSTLNYVLLLMPTGDKENKIDTLFSRKAVLAALKENKPTRLKRLMEINVEINFNHEGKVPLLIAAAKGEAEIVAILIQYGADILVKDEYGLTPMEVALAHGHARAAEILHYTAEGKALPA